VPLHWKGTYLFARCQDREKFYPLELALAPVSTILGGQLHVPSLISCIVLNLVISSPSEAQRALGYEEFFEKLPDETKKWYDEEVCGLINLTRSC
jgi:hypothetical protein